MTFHLQFKVQLAYTYFAAGGSYENHILNRWKDIR
jgi:hypothetical protein